MLASSAASFVIYAAALEIVSLVPPAALDRVEGVLVCGFTDVTMLGVIAGNLRLITWPALVTALIPPEGRATLPCRIC